MLTYSVLKITDRYEYLSEVMRKKNGGRCLLGPARADQSEQTQEEGLKEIGTDME